ncbi:MAG: biopolymer transporter ExbD [Kiritimatiellae bacterium]|nr:biopolymer transporter ExbD [Kiritimatiellia bacterium]
MGGKIPKARLDLTSLMDVMFLVLVFFVYSIFDMTVHRGVKVDLPDAAGAREKGERVVITITDQDALQLNGRDVSRDALLNDVRLLLSDQDLPVIISGDRRATLGAGVGLLADLKAAGAEKVSFQVRRESAPPPADGGSGPR